MIILFGTIVVAASAAEIVWSDTFRGFKQHLRIR